MTQVVLVSATWWKVVDVDSAEDIIDAEGMSWQREDTQHPSPPVGQEPTDIPPDLPKYVPAVGA
ncbi:hypothetical protein NQ152_16135 [Microbacterium sp. zg.B48]|uniref:hypothetical protein n=1 Tax=unclassified Microbacterium TaxID=2609290 RepID=UPI00214B352D|nr:MULTISPECIES: hypothetical protein [unclassified Microbacterium]MCR2765033.1 hypothetical protein [Microbacterium sp. zg.B48]MCR2811211.1 hypothetical protein [Microbacterium sp. zg.B185]WIM19810.1 hypothetical protein QNO12_03120 [Microbacterium sp. zg-B185]